MKNINVNFGGKGLLSTMFIVFLILKLTGTIAWSWVWVTAPLWIPLALFICFLLFVLFIGVFAFVFGDN